MHSRPKVIGWAVACAFATVPDMGYCQPVNVPVIEGHVFDRSTLKPLANVEVMVSATDGQSAVLTAGTTTDVNGFYTVPFTFGTEGQNTLTASCATTRGVSSSLSYLYSPMRPEIFRRDIYLTLPRNKHSCSLPK